MKFDFHIKPRRVVFNITCHDLTERGGRWSSPGGKLIILHYELVCYRRGRFSYKRFYATNLNIERSTSWIMERNCIDRLVKQSANPCINVQSVSPTFNCSCICRHLVYLCLALAWFVGALVVITRYNDAIAIKDIKPGELVAPMKEELKPPPQQGSYTYD